MTKEPGTYALLLRASSAQSVEVGALGSMAVDPGWYVYVGSAFGSGGLQARVERHVRGDGALHWHVDYLRAATDLEAVWYTHDEARRECAWATCLRERVGAQVPLAGFGASDCDCEAHLTAFEAPPSLRGVRAALHAQHPNHAPIMQADITAVGKKESTS
jgi:Uri superfamily endonuclease